MMMLIHRLVAPVVNMNIIQFDIANCVFPLQTKQHCVHWLFPMMTLPHSAFHFVVLKIIQKLNIIIIQLNDCS